VIYPDEGHGIRNPAHVADVRRRSVEWFDRYLKGQ
jgi:dipeptidyl aminopeptidase/acylaminoacyl peptidase